MEVDIIINFWSYLKTIFKAFMSREDVHFKTWQPLEYSKKRGGGKGQERKIYEWVYQPASEKEGN